MRVKDGVYKASTYGTWKIGTTENGTRSQGYGYLRDDDANGYAVYWKMWTQTDAGACLTGGLADCQFAWVDYADQYSDFDKETWESSSTKWSPQFYGSTAVHPNGSTARARFRVCESNRGPDTCSPFPGTFTKSNPY